MKVIYFIPLAICLFIAAGFLGIWVLNTLFPVLAIKYGFWQVLAMILFMMEFAPKDNIKIRR